MPSASPLDFRFTIARALALCLLASGTALPGDGAPEAPSLEPPSAPVEDGREHASGNWLGLRETLADRGVEVELIVQGDHSTNLAGGIRRGSVFRRPLNAALDVDAGRLLGWRGGHLHFGVQAFDGRHGTDALVGDAQGFDNVDADRFRQVSELWIEQRAWGDRLRLKVGKVDANSWFAHVENGGEFLNSSAGFSPTIQGFPTYPDPATSLSVVVSPARSLYLGGGVFDGATHEGCHGRTGNRGPGTLWGAPAALFVVGEAGVRFNLGHRSGRLAIGSWKHTGTFAAFDGTAKRGTTGFYLVLDQSVLQEPGDPSQGLGLFAQAGVADRALSEIDQHLSVGLTSTGALPRRDDDVLGLMVSRVRFSKRGWAGRTGGRETAIELFYGVSLRPWLSVKPDLQYVVNPGGDGAANALVGTVRAVVSF